MGEIWTADLLALADPSLHPDESAGNPSFAGVTRTLSAAGAVSSFEVAESILDRGSDVHKACHYYDENDLDMRTVPKNRIQFVRAWAKCRRENDFVPIHIEHLVENPNYQIRGHIDRVIELPPLPQFAGTTRGILELKTGSAAACTRLQTAIYGWMKDANILWRRFAVILSADASYHIQEYPVTEYMDDVHTFLAFQRGNAFKQKYGL